MSFITGPIAPESNPPIQPEFFQPSRFPITNISFGTSTTVTTGTAFGVSNNYVLGQEVRFVIPVTYGAQQLNGKQALVIDIPGANQVVVDVDSRMFDAFIPSPAYGPTPPQIVAIGDVNSGIANANGRNQPTTIPGSFINISPF